MVYRESYAIGDSAERRFARHLNNPVFANREQNIEEHWDIEDNGIKYDVKAIKSLNRHDPEADDTIHFLEFRNVNGQVGWLYGKADYIVFETRNQWIVVDRRQLTEYASKATAQARRTPNPQLYQFYQRQGKKDLMTVVPTKDLLAISKQTIKENNNTMSEKQHKDNSGALFLNDKATNPKAPTYKGKATVEGKAYDIAGWKQQTRDGKTYLSIKFQEPWKKEEKTESYSDVDEAF